MLISAPGGRSSTIGDAMRFTKLVCQSLVLSSLLFPACSDSDGPGGANSGGSAGVGGTSSGMRDGAGGDSDGMVLTPVACGSNTCAPSGLSGPVGGFPPAAPCCLDESSGTCGRVKSNGSCQEIPAPEPRCPAIPDSPLGSLGPCCVAGMCGVDVSTIGFGCVDLGNQTFRGFLPGAPDARPCDLSDAGDAGSDAGGEASSDANSD
jgi:hypothetical protein